MIFKKINLKNFRNYSKREFLFDEGENLIIGPNAIGKTNVLEAIYLLASGKSFRVKGVEGEMIREGEELARIEAEITTTEGKENLAILLTHGQLMGKKTAKKKYLLNGVSRRAADFVGTLKAVYFGPEDLDLVLGSPSGRRRYLDQVLSQANREYARASLSYEKGVRTRNRLLEEMRESGIVERKRLFFWDQLLIKNGNLISQKREEYLGFLNQHSTGLEGHDFRLEYDRSSISAERLAQYERQEVAAATTLVGPHRDEIVFQAKAGAKTRNLAVFGSRGEQRLAVLWLKLGELAFLRERTGQQPILLLDDIFSELDPEHRQMVVEATANQQTIITTADLEMKNEPWLREVKIIGLG